MGWSLTARLVLLSLGFVAMATSAQAQTTHCEPAIVGMPSAGFTCHTTGTTGGAVVDWRKVKPKRCTTLEAIANSAETCAARAIAEARKPVMDDLIAGRCVEATRTALTMGDLQFARDVRDLCVPSNASPTP
jgi:hypothetical protein